MSVLVPAWNELTRIGPCLESLLAIPWPRLEIHVCAGGDDGTFAAAARFAERGVDVIDQRPGQGKQSALREMFRRATGNVIYLTDADCTVPAPVFRSVLAPILDGRAEATTGRYRPFDADLANPLVLYRWGI